MRTDYRGGLSDEGFYLQNCGFFDENTALNAEFIRPEKGVPPVIDFNALEKLPDFKTP